MLGRILPAHFFCRNAFIGSNWEEKSDRAGDESGVQMNWQGAVERTVAALGYELVDCERSAGGLLRVYIDKVARDPAGEFVTVDDCEKVTRQLQHVLEVEACAYERLEVSSPGLDRPLKKPADFARFVGEQIELTLKLPFQGRKKYRGELQAVGEGWRVVLADKDNKAGGKTEGKGESKSPGKNTAEQRPTQALDFLFDEVREARLVAVVDFKGRRFSKPGEAAKDMAQPVQTGSNDEVDGGRIQ